ncbi:MAG: phage integrase SAM-like domain-containing protein, partial [Flavobacteriales bacterium]
MSEKFNIWVFLKKGKSDNSGKLAIYLRVTFNGGRFELSTKKYAFLENWDSQYQRTFSDHSVNLAIERLKTKIYEKHSELMDEKGNFSATELKNRVLGKTALPSILSLVDEHNDNMSKLIGVKYSWGTLKNYYTLRRHLVSFLNTISLKDLEIKKVNHRFIKDFETYLLTNTKRSNNGVIKILQSLKKITLEARALGYISKDPFALIKFKKTPYERGYLTNTELKKIEEIELSPRLDRARDMFVFSCYSGLAFIDAKNLLKKDIQIGQDGGHWIQTKRQKTNQKCDIPLLKKPLEILEKYKEVNGDFVFKRISNQKINEYLKEIAAL